MATQEKDQMCQSLVRKLTIGESLDETEKTHLAACEGCMAEVVRTLDEMAASRRDGVSVGASEINGALGPGRREAEKALEQGRRVFEREFGISLQKK